MDAYQHVNNVAWATYVQEARAQMFAFRLRGTPGESLLGSLVVARSRFWYQRPLIVRPEPLIAHTWISELRAAAITVVACGTVLIANVLAIGPALAASRSRPARLLRAE